MQWVVLPELIETGGGLVEELARLRAEKKEAKSNAKEIKKKRRLAKEALKERDPW